MKLYSGPLSMFGAKAEIAVAEKNVNCDIELVPYLRGKGYNESTEICGATICTLIGGYL